MGKSQHAILQWKLPWMHEIFEKESHHLHEYTEINFKNDQTANLDIFQLNSPNTLSTQWNKTKPPTLYIRLTTRSSFNFELLENLIL